MKTKISILMAGALVVSLLFLVNGCAQKVNAPADVQAIKKSVDDYVKAINAGDADAAVAMMSENVVYAYPNMPALVGKEATRKIFKVMFEQVGFEFSATVDDVRVTGNLGAARGTWTAKDTFKSGLMAQATDRGNWTGVFQRQTDGSWKWETLTPNSDQPLPGSTPDGVEESALLQIEQDWLNAFAKSDVAALERILAKEWAENADGQVDTRTQAIVDIKNGAYKIESVKMSNFSAHVLGDAAVVTTTVDIKGKYKKNDVSGRERSYDFFVKRDGRWQAIGTQNTSIK